MPFPISIKEEALVRSRRRCCLCKKFAGRNIEVHHIVQEKDGGPNTLENAIPLCFDCHADVGHYNDQHPKGNKYTSAELRRHRDEWWQWCNKNPYAPFPDDPLYVVPQTINLRAGKWKDHSRIKIHNRSSEVYFQVVLKFIVDMRDINLRNINIKASKPKDEYYLRLGQYKISDDILAVFGTDQTGNKIILLRLAGLDPGETRTLTVVNNSPSYSPLLPQPKASVHIVNFSQEPNPLLGDDGVAMPLPTTEGGVEVEGFIITAYVGS